VSAGFGPGFQDAESKLYRAEYAAISLAVVAFVVWRAYAPGGIGWLELVFWVAFPDLVAFAAIGASPKRREWPSWGSSVYNVCHTILVWAAVFLLSWAVLGAIYWPLLGWLGHITVDRAVGYGLRARR